LTYFGFDAKEFVSFAQFVGEFDNAVSHGQSEVVSDYVLRGP